jgi:hypothetical protein
MSLYVTQKYGELGVEGVEHSIVIYHYKRVTNTVYPQARNAKVSADYNTIILAGDSRAP